MYSSNSQICGEPVKLGPFESGLPWFANTGCWALGSDLCQRNAPDRLRNQFDNGIYDLYQVFETKEGNVAQSNRSKFKNPALGTISTWLGPTFRISAGVILEGRDQRETGRLGMAPIAPISGDLWCFNPMLITIRWTKNPLETHWWVGLARENVLVKRSTSCMKLSKTWSVYQFISLNH